MTQRQRERLTCIEHEAQKYAGIFKRVYSCDKPRKRDAIRAKCLDCCCYSETEAALCTTETCGLWSLNPYRMARLARQRAPEAGTIAAEPAGVSHHSAPAPKPSSTGRVLGLFASGNLNRHNRLDVKYAGCLPGRPAAGAPTAGQRFANNDPAPFPNDVKTTLQRAQHRGALSKVWDALGLSPMAQDRLLLLLKSRQGLPPVGQARQLNPPLLANLTPQQALARE